MPRDLGTGVYTQPYPDVEAGTPIESAVYNGFTHDVEQDLNTPRPIVAGGTGANNATDAMLALNGEIAKQVVTNYDSHVWQSGSFYSSNATGQAAPVDGHAFSGIVYANDANNIVVEARDTTTGQLYTRRKVAGTWVNSGAWAPEGLNMGGVATGDITISKSQPFLNLDKTTAAGDASHIAGKRNGSSRWEMQLGNYEVESGDNTGSNFSLFRFNDAGASATEALNINRASGDAVFHSKLSVEGTFDVAGAAMTIGYGGAASSIYFGNLGDRRITYDGTNFVWNNPGGNLWFNPANITIGGGGTTGTLFFGNSGSKYLQWTGSGWGLAGGNLTVGGSIITPAGTSITAGVDVIANSWLYTVGGCISFSGAGANRIYYDGNTRSPGMGNLYWYGDVVLRGDTSSGGTLFFGNSGARNLSFDGSNFVFNGASVWINSSIGSSGGANFYGTVVGYNTGTAFNASGYQGGGSPFINYMFTVNPNYGTLIWQAVHYSGNWAGFQWDVATSGNVFQFRHDCTAAKQVGAVTWSIISDARAKEDSRAYTAGLDEIAALQPMIYRYRHNTGDPGVVAKHIKEAEMTDEGRASAEALRRASREKEYVGLLAQDGEKVMPELYTKRKGFIDGKEVDDLREANYDPMIFAMVNAIKTLKARVEQLEANAKP